MGRILISPVKESTVPVSGTDEQTDAYMEAMRHDPRFADTVFKIEEADDHAFKKLKVKHPS